MVRRGIGMALAAAVAVTLVACDTKVDGTPLLSVAPDRTVVVPLTCTADQGSCTGTVVVGIAGIDSPAVAYVVPSGAATTVAVVLTEDQYATVPVASFVAAVARVDQAAPRDAGATAHEVHLRRAGGLTERVSAATDGAAADRPSHQPAISGDGRFVVFGSEARNLVAGDTNAALDVFLFDLATRTTTRLSVGPGGIQADGASSTPSISRDGRYVAFSSMASNLAPGGPSSGLGDAYVLDRATGVMRRVPHAGSQRLAISGDGRYLGFSSEWSGFVPADTNGVADVFVHDLTTSTTTRASVTSEGAQVPALSAFEGISDHGTVVFWSAAAGLVPGDTNGVLDYFVHDPATQATSRVSLASGGGQAASVNGSVGAAISADATQVAFVSRAANLVPEDTNGQDDLFVHDRTTATTERISVATGGAQAASHPLDEYKRITAPSISADGSVVAFVSTQVDLVPGDVRGADVYVRDRQAGTTTKASVHGDGTHPPSDRESEDPAIAGDGGSVAFVSYAALAGEGASGRQVFLRIPPG